MASPGMLRRVALVRTDVSEELSYYIIRVTRIRELGTTLAITTALVRSLGLIAPTNIYHCVLYSGTESIWYQSH
jgi:hypothetical protein